MSGVEWGVAPGFGANRAEGEVCLFIDRASGRRVGVRMGVEEMRGFLLALAPAVGLDLVEIDNDNQEAD